MKAKSNRASPVSSGKLGNRGVALIAVLWLVMLLAVIAGSLLMLTRTELGLSRNLVVSARAEALAEGGVPLAVLRLLDPEPETRWRGNGASHDIVLETGTLQITVRDAAGLIDVNAAPPELLAGLFRAAGQDEDEAAMLAYRIADWRDADDETLPNGAEQADYDAAGLTLHVTNGPFLTPDEIQRVPGVTLDLYPRIAPAITVYSRQGGIDPSSASELALMAVPGIDAAVVEALIAAREEAAGDAVPGGLASLLPAVSRAFLARPSGRMFHIRSRATTADGGVYVLDAVVEITPGADPPWRVHAWRPGAVFGEAEPEG